MYAKNGPAGWVTVLNVVALFTGLAIIVRPELRNYSALLVMVAIMSPLWLVNYLDLRRSGAGSLTLTQAAKQAPSLTTLAGTIDVLAMMVGSLAVVVAAA